MEGGTQVGSYHVGESWVEVVGEVVVAVVGADPLQASADQAERLVGLDFAVVPVETKRDVSD